MTSWWRDLAGPDKFRIYTRISLQLGIVLAAVSLAVNIRPMWLAAAIIVAAVATILVVEARPELASWPSSGLRRLAIPVGAVVIAATWASGAVIARVAESGTTSTSASILGTFAAGLASLVFLPFMRRTWWLLVGLSVVTGLAFGSSWEAQARLAAGTLAVGGFIVALTLLTLWSLQVLDDLERSKNVGAELQLAEERLRFARDLHDVVGRSFSAIAVKSELAATLSRAGAAERATAEINEVKAIAVESMEEMRTLVRGYRDIDLESEVGGARSLLSSMGCTLVVEGDPARVPTQFHEIAAWVVREGTTNIVKHSSATSATLAFGAVGMSLSNNGVTGEPGERSGLVGLAERLDPHGAMLETRATGDRFALEIKWGTP